MLEIRGTQKVWSKKTKSILFSVSFFRVEKWAPKKDLDSSFNKVQQKEKKKIMEFPQCILISTKNNAKRKKIKIKTLN